MSNKSRIHSGSILYHYNNGVLLEDKKMDVLSEIAQEKMISGKADPDKKSYQGIS